MFVVMWLESLKEQLSGSQSRKSGLSKPFVTKSSVLKPPGVPSSPQCWCLRGIWGSKPHFLVNTLISSHLFFSLLSLSVQFEVLMNKHATVTDMLSMLINSAAYYCCDNVIRDKTWQLSNSLWTGNQPELPSGQLINFSQDPTNCCFDYRCPIFQLMASPGIHVNNVPIVADSMHIEVGVGFSCLDCSFLTSCKAERPQADSSWCTKQDDLLGLLEGHKSGWDHWKQSS